MNCATCTQFQLQKYKGKPYQETPCSSCWMTRQTSKTNKHTMLYDTDGAVSEGQEPFVEPEDAGFKLDQELSQDAVCMIMQACQQNFLVTLSNVVLKLTDLAKDYPVLYQILHLKMQHPQMSYYQIGRALNPPCSKQNVLYHLSHAVQQFPDLEKAILTDTRFSGGRYAIKNVAQKASHLKQVQRVRKALYKESETNRRKTLQELQNQFSKPFKLNAIEVVEPE